MKAGGKELRRSVADARIAIGERITARRIQLNIRAQDIADAANVERKTLTRMTKAQGDSSLNALLLVLDELGLLDAVVAAIPKDQVSPMQVLENRGKQRQRVSAKPEASKTDASKTKRDSAW